MSDALRIQQLAEELGGGWRIEHGILPMVVLTEHEADRLRAHLAEVEAKHKLAVGKVDALARQRDDAQAERMPSRERLATIFRDWIHKQPFSQCSIGADTCPDWPMAYELADLIRGADTG
jgi:hypothetical protein